MKLQISPTRIVKDAITVWGQAGPDVDVTMDLSNITFKEASVDAIYVFHVVDHLFPEEGTKAIASWLKCLKPGGEIFIVVDDFEYICRAYVGGEISIDDINANFQHPSNYDRYNLPKLLNSAGIGEGDIRIWYADVPDLFPKKHYELIVAATKK